MGKHSEKPELLYEIVEKASYPGYLEAFCRKQRTGSREKDG
jgi:N6-adenosine-specific RNA methylase IME4